jgi:predicted  nucleic acid-binding Zn-ribbon protein
MVLPVPTYTGKRTRDSGRSNSCSTVSSGSDEPDEISLKRQKNTDAARRSRLKKLVKMETLEKQVSDLEVENSKLNTRVAVLESEKNGLEAKERSLEDRVRNLEAQLAEAHKALTSIKH